MLLGTGTGAGELRRSEHNLAKRNGCRTAMLLCQCATRWRTELVAHVCKGQIMAVSFRYFFQVAFGHSSSKPFLTARETWERGTGGRKVGISDVKAKSVL